MKISNSNKIFLKLYLTLFVGLALVGQIINYSIIPEADFWSIFERINQLNKQNWLALWGQHNEHRVVFTYLISYLDSKIFNNFSLNYFVTILSFFGSTILIYKIFFELNHKNDMTIIFFGLLVCMIFYWSQKPNFIFPFHVSIIWVNFFTLLGLYFYNKFSLSSNFKHFFLSILFSVMSMFSLASGIFALPLLTLLAILRKRYLDSILLIPISLLFIFIYFIDFSFVSGHSNFLNFNFINLISMYLYFFGYLGSIFSFFIGKGTLGLYFAILFGHIYLILFLIQLNNYFKGRLSKNYDYLLLFTFFVMITGLLTAIGRYEDGIQHAISSRYTTNTIYGWIVMLIIYFQVLKKYLFTYESNNILVIKPSFFLIVFFISIYQFKALKIDYSSEKILNRSYEIMGLLLGVTITDRRIPHLDTENIIEYHDEKLFFFDKKIFHSPKELQMLCCDFANSLDVTKLNNFVVENHEIQKYKKISFSSNLINHNTVYFKDIKGNISGYAVSQNFFRFFPNKDKHFVGIDLNNDNIGEIYY